MKSLEGEAGRPACRMPAAVAQALASGTFAESAGQAKPQPRLKSCPSPHKSLNPYYQSSLPVSVCGPHEVAEKRAGAAASLTKHDTWTAPGRGRRRKAGNIGPGATLLTRSSACITWNPNATGFLGSGLRAWTHGLWVSATYGDVANCTHLCSEDLKCLCTCCR